MRIERVRMGLEVYNKIDNKMYKVTSVGKDCSTAHNMLNDGQLCDDTVTITKDNALIFKVVNDPEPYPIANGYTVVDGILYKDSAKVCEQGQIRIEKILAEMPGQLVCAVKSRIADDLYDLVMYDPAKDQFQYATNCKTIPMPELVAYTKDHTTVFLAFSVIDTKKVTKEDGTEQEMHVLKSAAIISITDNYVEIAQYDDPIAVDNIFLKELDDKIWTLFVPLAPIKENGERVTPGQYLWEEDRRNVCERKLLLPEKITADYSWQYSTFVIKSDDLLVVHSDVADCQIKHPVVRELTDYPILIDITKEQYTYRLTFANPETYQLKTIVSRSTRDRGYIVTIE